MVIVIITDAKKRYVSTSAPQYVQIASIDIKAP